MRDCVGVVVVLVLAFVLLGFISFLIIIKSDGMSLFG
jgi:hypothetical protein